MSFLETIPVADATGDVRQMYEKNQARYGYVPNFVKLFSLRPQVMDGWAQLLKSIRSTLEPRRYELVTLAAARALRCSYCALAHGQVLEKEFFSTEEMTTIAGERAGSALDPAEAAVMGFAEKVVRQADAVSREDVELLRSHGLADREIFDVAAAAAARCFFSKVLDALGTEPDTSYESLEPNLRRLLTVGRPISHEELERLEAT